MPLTKIPFQAGIFKDDTPLAAEGRWVDADKVRFVRGLPQTIYGWERALSDTNSVEGSVGGILSGICRGIHAWADNGGDKHCAFGTHTHLIVMRDGVNYGVTPVDASGTLGTDPLDTTDGSAIVTVSDTAHGRSVGDRVAFSGATAVGGITVDGAYTVATVPNADSYTIVHSSAATATASGGGSSVAYTYYLPVGLANGTGGQGYGTGTYGTDTYGTASNVAYFPRTWSLDNWGEHLIANPRGGTIYAWQLSTSAPAAAIAQAPATVTCCFVTPERILVAAGCSDSGGTFDPLLLRWSGQEDNTEWTPSLANQAGDFRLSVGSRIVRGLAGRGENLIWTDEALFAMRYLGDPGLVFGFTLLGAGCGLIGPNAAVVKDGVAYWLSRSGQFYVYAGGGAPRQIPCPVRRHVFDNLSFVQADKVFCGANSAFSEIWWLYPDRRDGNEVSRYVLYSTTEGTWSVGRFDRTAWVDAGVFDYPIAAASDGKVFFHEKGHLADGGPLAYRLESAPFDLGDGDTLMRVNGAVPDFEDLLGGLALTFLGRRYPQAASTETSSGPHPVTAATPKIDFRLTARQAAVRIEAADVPAFMRLGALRLDLTDTTHRR